MSPAPSICAINRRNNRITGSRAPAAKLRLCPIPPDAVRKMRPMHHPATIHIFDIFSVCRSIHTDMAVKDNTNTFPHPSPPKIKLKLNKRNYSDYAEGSVSRKIIETRFVSMNLIIYEMEKFVQ
jgi:hypothetical protein